MSAITKPTKALFSDGGSRLEKYWTEEKFFDFYRRATNQKSLPKDFNLNDNTMTDFVNRFGIRGLQFGNWVTFEDKYNYIACLHLALTDLNKVLKFRNNDLGFGQLGIAFGARGMSSALAHFESCYNAINITRYWTEKRLKNEVIKQGRTPEDKYSKSYRFVETGGMGSFAHEWAHFLDYNVGRYIEPHPESNWITGPYRSTATQKIEYDSKYPIHRAMEMVLQSLFWKPDGSKSGYKTRIQASSDYVNRRLEIFARVFEQYIQYKLKEMNVRNVFLAKTAYKSWYYLSPKELKAVVPKMDHLMSLIRRKIAQQ